MTADSDRAAVRPLTLDEAVDPSACGHKAATLAALRRSGHPVPDGFVIPVDGSLAPEILRDELERLGPGPYAVRSSGVAEDLADASFAGQYESVLGVDTLEDVIAACERVRASGGSAHVAAYRAGVENGRAPIAVLVQGLVPADAAGVAFSANPVTGDDEVVIEAVRGLGDRLVSGDADADRWVDRYGSVDAVVDSGAIDTAAAQRLGELARSIAGERGEPQDLEWAIAAEELFVLQARPITHLPTRPAIEVPPGRWLKDAGHFAGPVTPMGASILPAIEPALSASCAEFGLPIDGMRLGFFGGEIYVQELDLGGKHHPGSAPPWWVLALACRVVPALRRRLRAAEGL
jgi:pyruvate,water dikinase